jgi:hypothetical protein
MTRRWRWWLKWLAIAFACAIAAVWVWSRWRGAIAHDNRVVLVVAVACSCSALRLHGWRSPARTVQFDYLPGGIADMEPGWAWGFKLDTGPQWHVAIPLWLPFVVAVAFAAGLWRLDRRRPPGCCARCGYDLTGITGACPECGGKPDSGLRIQD